MKSVYEIIQEFAKNPKMNLVRFPDQYIAEDENSAIARKALKESGRGKGKGVGHFLIRKNMGTSHNSKGMRGTLLLGILDMTSRKEDGKGYDWRTRILGDLFNPQNKIKSLEVCDNFKKFETINLENMPLFPETEDKESLAQRMLSLLSIGKVISLLENKITSLKRKINKDDVITNGDKELSYLPPKPVWKVINENGEPVSYVKHEYNRIKLNTMVTINLDSVNLNPCLLDGDKLSNEVSLLPIYIDEFNRVKRVYECINKETMPYVLGEIERTFNAENASQFFKIGSVLFEVEINKDADYGLPQETAQMILEGKWKKELVEGTRGRWILKTLERAVNPN